MSLMNPHPRKNVRRKPKSQGFAARHMALQVLTEVLGKKQPLDTTLEFTLAQGLKELEPRDRSFARALASCTLRRLGQIDHALSQHLDRPLPKKAATAQNILRLGVAQLCYLETPPHAAVDGAVNLAQKEQSARPFKKLINAVLRNISRQRDDTKSEEGSALLNVPDWLQHSWQKAYGNDTAEAFAQAHLIEPALDLSVPHEREAWAKRLEATCLPTGSLRLKRAGNVRELDGYDQGAWWVQDAAAALPVQLLGDIDGQRVLDLCTAPGGKTAQLAAAGAKVTALDRSAKRLGRLRENLTRLSLKADIVTADATTWAAPEKFPFVLLDAPCSATGTLRRHPDLAWLKTPDDVTKLAGLQKRLLEAALDFLAPGGQLLYCTCSLQPEEGEEQIDAFLARHDHVHRLPFTATEIPGISDFVNDRGEVRTLPSHWPEHGGLDGFFIARMIAKG